MSKSQTATNALPAAQCLPSFGKCEHPHCDCPRFEYQRRSDGTYRRVAVKEIPMATKTTAKPRWHGMSRNLSNARHKRPTLEQIRIAIASKMIEIAALFVPSAKAADDFRKGCEAWIKRRERERLQLI